MDKQRLMELAGIADNKEVFIFERADGASDDKMFDMLFKMAEQLDAAKRGLGLANKLKDAEERKKHRSRIMVNLNKLRGLISSAETALKGE